MEKVAQELPQLHLVPLTQVLEEIWSVAGVPRKVRDSQVTKHETKLNPWRCNSETYIFRVALIDCRQWCPRWHFNASRSPKCFSLSKCVSNRSASVWRKSTKQLSDRPWRRSAPTAIQRRTFSTTHAGRRRHSTLIKSFIEPHYTTRRCDVQPVAHNTNLCSADHAPTITVLQKGGQLV